MASKRARERAEFLVTSNRGVLADIIPAVANALDAAWEDADNRVMAERLHIAEAIRKQFPAYSDEELAAGAAGGGKTVVFMIQANVSTGINAIADSIERGDL